MKQVMKLLILVLLVLAMACNTNRKSEYNISPLVVEIPDELKEQPEVVEFIRSSERNINRFAETIERSYEENPDLWQKEAEEMSMVEKLKVLKVAGEMAVAFSEFSMDYAAMNEKMGQFEMQMNDDQVLALATVGKAFENRMKLLEERLEKIGVN
jgi:hypothetical protein